MHNSEEKTSVDMLEPHSYLIYLVMLLLSTLLFLGSSGGLLFSLYLFYGKWCNTMHKYCYEVIQQNRLQTDIDDSVDEPIPIFVENLAKNKDNMRPGKKGKQEKGMVARVAKVKMPTDDDDLNNEPIKIVEIEPNKFLEKTLKDDRHLRLPGPDKELGRLSFRLEYYVQRKELRIEHIHGEGLRKINSQAILNPFIVIYIWPDNEWPIKTSVIKHTNSPRWEESIVFENFNLKYMLDKALHFKIQTKNQIKPSELIGHVVLPLRIMKNLKAGLFEEYFMKNLQPDLQINRGAIKIVLLYNDTEEEGKLIITILKARLIFPIGFISDQCQVFTKVTVIYPNLPAQNKFTSIQRGTFEPVWKEKLEFKVTKEHVSKLSIIISIREEGFSKDGKLFAYVELGSEHSEPNNTHLRTILKKPNKMLIQWHQLLSNIS